MADLQWNVGKVQANERRPSYDSRRIAEKIPESVWRDVFPDDDINVLREIWRNPAGWMYSFDGIQWEAAPMDIGKIDYVHTLFRKDTFQKREWRDSK